MSCSGIDIANPYSWIVFSGFLAGAAVTGLLKGKSRHWALFSFFLSGSLLFALLALFLPGPDRFLDVGLLYFFAGSAFFGYTGTWFWRSFGLAFFILISLAIIFVPLALRPWQCAAETVEIGRFRLLSPVQEEATVEVMVPGEEQARYQTLESEVFIAELDLLNTEDYYFMVKARSMYRLRNGLQFSETESLWEVPEEIFKRLPGVVYSTIRSGPLVPEPFTTYVVRLVIQDGVPLLSVERLYL